MIYNILIFIDWLGLVAACPVPDVNIALAQDITGVDFNR